MHRHRAIFDKLDPFVHRAVKTPGAVKLTIRNV